MRVLLSMLLLLGLAACDRSMGDLDTYIHDVKQRPAQPLEPIPEVEPYEPAMYDVADLRNPFVPNEIFNPEDEKPEAQQAQSGPRPISGRQKEPLEAFPLDSLRMVGTIQIAGTRYALIRSSEPLVYRVRDGQYIGQNHGQVLRVEDIGMTLKELFPDGAGRWVERETVLELSLSNAAAGKAAR